MNKKLILSITLGLMPFSGQAATDAYKAVSGHEACMGHGYTKAGAFTNCLSEEPKEGCDSAVFAQLKGFSGKDKISSCEGLLKDAPLRRANPSLMDDTPPALKMLKEQREKLMGS